MKTVMTTGSSCITVGVLDSGVDWEHEDSELGVDTYQNIFLNPGEDTWLDANDPSTGNGIDDDQNGFIDDWKGGVTAAKALKAELLTTYNNRPAMKQELSHLWNE